MRKIVILMMGAVLALSPAHAADEPLFEASPGTPTRRWVARLVVPLPPADQRRVDALCQEIETSTNGQCVLPPSFKIGTCPVCTRDCNDLFLEVAPDDVQAGPGILSWRLDQDREWLHLLGIDLPPPLDIDAQFEIYRESFIEPSVDPLEARQRYSGRKPGINLPEGEGPTAKVADIECDFEDKHEDLPPDLAPNLDVRSGYPGDRSHGAAVLGILASPRNGAGIRGLAPQSPIGFWGVTCQELQNRRRGTRDRNLEYTLAEAARWVGPEGFSCCRSSSRTSSSPRNARTPGAEGCRSSCPFRPV